MGSPKKAVCQRGGLEVVGGLDDVADEVVVFGFFWSHPEVAVSILVDFFEGLVGLVGEDLVESFAHLDDLLGFDSDIGGLTTDTTKGLVEHEACVG